MGNYLKTLDEEGKAEEKKSKHQAQRAASQEEKTFLVNRMYMSLLQPVVELMQIGNIEKAKSLYKELYDELKDLQEEPEKVYQKERK